MVERMSQPALLRPVKARKKAAKRGPTAASGRLNQGFTFLTNHSHVLVSLASVPGITLRQVALNVGITERAVIAILKDLTGAGVVAVSKRGRQNHYKINPDVPLRHPIEQHKTVGALLSSILGTRQTARAR